MNTTLDKYLPSAASQKEDIIRKIEVITPCCNTAQIYKPLKPLNLTKIGYRLLKCKQCKNSFTIRKSPTIIKILDTQFLQRIQEEIEFQLEILPKNDIFECVNEPEFKKLYLEYIKKIQKKYENDKETIHTSIEWKDKDLINLARSIIYSIIRLHYDIMVKQTTFAKFLKIDGNYVVFNSVLNNFQKEFIKIDAKEYIEKTVKYSKIYTDILIDKFELNINEQKFQDEIKKTLTLLTRNKIKCFTNRATTRYEKRLKLISILEQYGINIAKLFKNGFYDNFYPQYLAISIVYLMLKKRIRRRNSDLQYSYKKVCKAVNLSKKVTYLLISLIRKTVQENLNVIFADFKYSRETFEKTLEILYNKTNRAQIKTVYSLFKILELSIDDFLNKIMKFYKYSLGAGEFISELEKKDYYLYKWLKVKRNINNALKNKIIDRQQYINAIEIIDETIDKEKETSKLIKTGSLIYEFKFNKDHLKNFENTNIRQKLQNSFENFINDKYPVELFKHPKFRGSELKIKGLAEEKLKTAIIEEQLIFPLISKNKILKDQKGKLSLKLKEIANRIAKSTEYVNPRHELIQRQSIKLEQIIGMEIPIYDEQKGRIGHIDLLGFDNITSELIVIEYKPRYGDLIRGLPQVVGYAYILSKMLNIDVENVKCVIYSKDVSLSFKPTILKDIIEFVQVQNSKRKNRLLLKKNKQDLEKELLSL
ncbi:MAG: hypothetical protein ACFFCE_01700 [Promethearchaeota archaeon]